jgi:hypothetical protein
MERESFGTDELEEELPECGLCGASFEPCGNPECLGNSFCQKCLEPNGREITWPWEE